MEQSDKILINFFSNTIPNIIKPISNSITILIIIFVAIAIFEFLILKAKRRFNDLFLLSLFLGDLFFVLGLWLFKVAGNIGGYCFTGVGLLMLILFNFNCKFAITSHMPFCSFFVTTQLFFKTNSKTSL